MNLTLKDLDQDELDLKDLDQDELDLGRFWTVSTCGDQPGTSDNFRQHVYT